MFCYYKSYCSKGDISQRIFTPPPPKTVFEFGHNPQLQFALLRKALNTPCSTAGGAFQAVEIGGWVEKAWDHNYTPFQWSDWSCADSRQWSWNVWKLIRLQDRPKNTCRSCRFGAVTKSNSESFPAGSQWCDWIIYTRLIRESEAKSFSSPGNTSSRLLFTHRWLHKRVF